MHGALEELRTLYPGKWLLIRLDEPDADSGTILFAHGNPEALDSALAQHARSAGGDREQPLYVTYSVPEDQRLPSFAL